MISRSIKVHSASRRSASGLRSSMVVEIWASKVSGIASGLDGIPAAPGDKSLVFESGLALSIAKGRSIKAEHATAGGAQDRVSRRSIPFHGGSQTGINVGLSACNQAEFQGRARRAQARDS